LVRWRLRRKVVDLRGVRMTHVRRRHRGLRWKSLSGRRWHGILCRMRGAEALSSRFAV
jgi:hypothetical protein